MKAKKKKKNTPQIKPVNWLQNSASAGRINLENQILNNEIWRTPEDAEERKDGGRKRSESGARIERWGEKS